MITVNGTELYYELAGASSVPMVLVHGSWADHHTWDAVVPMLSQRFRVLTYDRRGHSHSARAPHRGSMYEDAMDLAALVDALDLAPLYVVGNSFGGSVGLLLATLRPDLFRGITVHEPPLFRVLAEDPSLRPAFLGFVERTAAVAAMLRAGDAAGGARAFVDTIAFGPGAWEMLPAPIQQTFIANAPTFLDEMEDPAGMTLDLAALARVPAPALFTRGDRSPPLFPAVVARLARAVPHALQHLFVGGGHAPHLSMPKAYVAVVNAFLIDHAEDALPQPDRAATANAPSALRGP
jgi:pimeloyl-ACP methyl ester carboxylesterase